MEVPNQISLRRWRLGFRVAIYSGLAAAAASWAIDLTIKQAILLTVGFVAREVSRYLSTHPVEHISDLDTSPRKFVKTVTTIDTHTQTTDTKQEKQEKDKNEN